MRALTSPAPPARRSRRRPCGSGPPVALSCAARCALCSLARAPATPILGGDRATPASPPTPQAPHDASPRWNRLRCTAAFRRRQGQEPLAAARDAKATAEGSKAKRKGRACLDARGYDRPSAALRSHAPRPIPTPPPSSFPPPSSPDRAWAMTHLSWTRTPARCGAFSFPAIEASANSPAPPAAARAAVPAGTGKSRKHASRPRPPSLGPAAVTIRAPFAVRETGILGLCPRPLLALTCGLT
jgi:hypothetical protein